MPAMAAIVVKKADETTNITYDALTPAGGDGSSAVWRQDTGAVAGLPVGMRATLRMKTVNNGPRTARRCIIDFSRPYAVLNTTTGRYETKDQDTGHCELLIPEAIPGTERNESVRQFLNLLASVLIKQSGEAGYAPQ
jgi:hypothetical protein